MALPPRDPSSTPTPSKMPLDIAKCPWGIKSPGSPPHPHPAENLSPRVAELPLPLGTPTGKGKGENESPS